MGGIKWFKKLFKQEDSLDEKHSSNIQSTEASYQEAQTSSLEMLILHMWSSDPKQKASAMKAVAAVLKHKDINKVHKAASALCELGAIGCSYVERAAADPQVTDAARSAILYRARVTKMTLPIFVLTRENACSQAQDIIQKALEEADYHGFSSPYRGAFPSNENIRHCYCFEIDFIRPEEQALISFSREDKTKVKDHDCLPILPIMCPRGKTTGNSKLNQIA